MSDQRQFHNNLRILMSIDRVELVQAGIIKHGDVNAWGTFRRNPFRWFINAPDPDADKLWEIIKRRQPK